MTRLVMVCSLFRFAVIGGMWFIMMKLIMVHIFYMTGFCSEVHLICTRFAKLLIPSNI
jgi:hypothetical protein